MNIKQREVGDVTILDVDGRMTRNDSYGLLKDRITDLVAQHRTKLLLNLAEVPYMDSTCVGEIVSSFVTVRNTGGRLKLVNLTKRIQELLVIAKLVSVFETFDSEEEGVRSFTEH